MAPPRVQTNAALQPAGPRPRILRIGVLLGRATFMLPVALGVVGVILIVLGQRRDLKLPRRRLAGVFPSATSSRSMT